MPDGQYNVRLEDDEGNETEKEHGKPTENAE